MEKLAGKTLTDIEVFDLACAESLCTHDLTPPLGDPEAPIGGYVAKVIERDGFRCQRPGCSNRTALTGSHVKSRGRGGSEARSRASPGESENILTVCMVCHTAIERGLLKTTGRAPDEIQWEGPFGMIEQPLEAASEKVSSSGARYEETSEECIATHGAPLARETSPGYGDPTHVSRESSLIVGKWLSGKLVGGTHEPISFKRDFEKRLRLGRLELAFELFHPLEAVNAGIVSIRPRDLDRIVPDRLDGHRAEVRR